MKKIIILLCSIILYTKSTIASENCFIAKQNNKVLREEGDCKTRHTPCSTFKIAISLMGYNEGILIDETHPVFEFKPGYLDSIDLWKQDHNPLMWMKHSCVWYSQILTKKLGMSKFKEYMIKLNYGNMDISGDIVKNNGLTESWLSSSLTISPIEQIDFLQRLIAEKLPVSHEAQIMTKTIMFVEDLPDGWKLYGKTGNGRQLSLDKTQKIDLQQGWFIGWIEKNSRIITFANYISDTDIQDSYASIRAKAMAKEKLMEITQEN